MKQHHAEMFVAAVTAAGLVAAIDLSAQSQILGCATQSTGQLRILGYGETCKRTSHP